MADWKAYKETYRSESTLFDFARVGDLRGLANLLLQGSEIDIDVTNERGYSALMLAVYNGEQDFCEVLLRYGANPDSVDVMGNTVLMGAAYKGDLAILKLLLECGADITLVNKTKMNVRDWAVMYKRTDILLYLDEYYPAQVSSSKLKNMFRFIKLAFILLQNKLRPSI
jgi:ankyrin repeat protein